MTTSIRTIAAGLVSCVLFAPAVHSKSAFTYYDMPTALAGPCDSCTGPDGALWVQDILVDKIARIEPSTGVVTEYDIPYTLPAGNYSVLPGFNSSGRTALACAIRAGSDGHIYAASGIRNQFLRINVTTKQIDVFTPPPYDPAGDLQPFNDLTAGPTGMFFSQTTGNVVSLFDYKSETFTNFPVPTPEGSPLGMNFFKGYLWFAEFLGNKIGRLDPTTGTIMEYPVPLPSLAGPAVVRAHFTNPDRVCFTAFLGGSNGCLHIHTGKFDVYPNTGVGAAVSLPAENTKDLRYDDIVYYSTATQNYINVLNVTSGNITKLVEPGTVLASPLSLPFAFDIGMNYGPGKAVWFTQATTNRVGRYQL